MKILTISNFMRRKMPEMLLIGVKILKFVFSFISNNLWFFSADINMMCWRRLEQMIT